MSRMKKNKKRNILILGSPYMERIFADLTQTALQRGWYLEMSERYNPPQNWQGDGVISTHLDVPAMNRFMDDILSRGIPVVDLLDVTGRADIGRVCTDEAALGRLAADHFRRHGYPQAAFFSFEWTALHQRRYDAFAAAFGAPRPEKWCWRDETANPADRKALAEWTARKVLESPKPMAVLTFNSYTASFFSQVCMDMQVSVPHEVAILSAIDNTIYTCHRDRQISGVEHDGNDICRRATALLQRMMDGKCTRNESILIPPLGVAVRQSTDVCAVRDPALRKAVIYTAENIARHFGPTQVAAETGIPLSRLNEIAQRELGRSMLEEIVRLRIETAKRLMRTTDGKFSTIAHQTGFCNASYLCKVFRQEVGVSPHTWRKRAGKPKS